MLRFRKIIEKKLFMFLYGEEELEEDKRYAFHFFFEAGMFFLFFIILCLFMKVDFDYYTACFMLFSGLYGFIFDILYLKLYVRNYWIRKVINMIVIITSMYCLLFGYYAEIDTKENSLKISEQTNEHRKLILVDKESYKLSDLFSHDYLTDDVELYILDTIESLDEGLSEISDFHDSNYAIKSYGVYSRVEGSRYMIVTDFSTVVNEKNNPYYGIINNMLIDDTVQTHIDKSMELGGYIYIDKNRTSLDFDILVINLGLKPSGKLDFQKFTIIYYIYEFQS